MTTEQIIKTLREHNDWRRGIGKSSEGVEANYFDTISAYEIGLTIDAAIERLQTLEKERDEARREFGHTQDAAIKRLQELELTVARYQRLYDVEANAKVEKEYRKELRQLARERDEAREEAKTIRNFLDAGVHWPLPWEVDSK